MATGETRGLEVPTAEAIDAEITHLVQRLKGLRRLRKSIIRIDQLFPCFRGPAAAAEKEQTET